MPAQSASCSQLPGNDCLFEIYEPQRVLAAVCPALTSRVVDLIGPDFLFVCAGDMPRNLDAFLQVLLQISKQN